MSKKMTQFRYYGVGNSNNYPSDLKLTNNIFQGYSNITQMGIQAPPDTQFELNDSCYPINVGNTGIYEIDLQNYGFIQKLVFRTIPELVNGDRIIVDIIYEGGNS